MTQFGGRLVSTLGATLLTSFHAMGTTLRNFFRRANTVQYPKVKRPLPGQWRGGSFALTFDPETDEENCIGCRLCEYICPSQIITVTLRKGEKRKNGGRARPTADAVHAGLPGLHAVRAVRPGLPHRRDRDDPLPALTAPTTGKGCSSARSG